MGVGRTNVSSGGGGGILVGWLRKGGWKREKAGKRKERVEEKTRTDYTLCATA